MNQTIEFDKAELNINEGTSSRSGNEYKIITQVGWLHTQGEKYPVKTAFPIQQPDDGSEPKPHPVGMYQIDTNNLFEVGQFDSFEIVRYPSLVPFKRAA